MNKIGYRFVFIDWDSDTRMSQELLHLGNDEEVVQMNTTDDGVILLVSYPLE